MNDAIFLFWEDNLKDKLDLKKKKNENKGSQLYSLQLSDGSGLWSQLHLGADKQSNYY